MKRFFFSILLLNLAVVGFSQSTAVINKDSDDLDFSNEIDFELSNILGDEDNKSSVEINSKEEFSVYRDNSGHQLQIPVANGSIYADFFVAVDLVAAWNLKERKELPWAANRFDVRSAELGFFGAIDHWLNGYLGLAWHTHGRGEVIFDLHEAWVESSTLIPWTKIRIGKMFLNIGRENQVHAHDRNYISSSLVYQKVLNTDEGVADTGMNIAVSFPFMPFYTEVSAGIFNGEQFGHVHGAATKKAMPLITAKVSNFFDLGNSHGLMTGLSWLIRATSDQIIDRANYAGWDFTYKYSPSKFTKVLFQNELWYQNLQTGSSVVQNHLLGSYHMLSYRFLKDYELGSRVDFLADLSIPNYKQIEAGSAFFFRYRLSEFASAAVEYRVAADIESGSPTKVNHSMGLQATFILGAHPAHKY